MTARHWFPRWVPVAVLALVIWRALFDDHAQLTHAPGRWAIAATIVIGWGIASLIDYRRSMRR